ncbi:TPA: hypothetical protein N0F65_012101 [Lagenidium giganteum]|uniref:PH domain-containing protein n=1 Tax=Lagenidium giganteum TaxID=4803 RepID=A0AAV2YUB3_9STRA|nr:TPA: hypothetical protein N0F65_012101 [Lagenidium giganteum]
MATSAAPRSGPVRLPTASARGQRYSLRSVEAPRPLSARRASLLELPSRSLSSSFIDAGGQTPRTPHLSVGAAASVNGNADPVSVAVAEKGADFTSYYAFSRRRSSVFLDETGLSGFLEYRRLDGSWRPFLFQTSDFQLVVYRVHVTHQVPVMSTDVREATEISLSYEGETKSGETRLIKLGINDTVITLRAVSYHVAQYWVEGLQRLKEGRRLEIVGDRPTIESEEDIFQQIDYMTLLREWDHPAVPVSFCDACMPVRRTGAPTTSANIPQTPTTAQQQKEQQQQQQHQQQPPVRGFFARIANLLAATR